MNKQIRFHFLFWISIIVYELMYRWPNEFDKIFLMEMTLITVSLNLGLAYTLIFVLVPRLLYKKKKGLFAISCIIALYIAFVLREA